MKDGGAGHVDGLTIGRQSTRYGNVVVLRDGRLANLDTVTTFEIGHLVSKDAATDARFYRWTIDFVGSL